MMMLRNLVCHGYPLLDSDLPLCDADMGRNVRHIIRCYLRHGRHVAKLPMMGAHAVLDRKLKCNVGVVRRLIDPVQERWSLVRTIQGNAMARGTIFLIQSFPESGIGHQARAGFGYLPALGICSDARYNEHPCHERLANGFAHMECGWTRPTCCRRHNKSVGMAGTCPTARSATVIPATGATAEYRHDKRRSYQSFS